MSEKYFMARLAAEIATKKHWWQNTNDDPHQISVAVYVALGEIEDAIIKSMQPQSLREHANEALKQL